VGNLREPAHNRKRANIIIVSKCPPELQPIDFRIYYKELKVFPFQELFFTTFTYQKLEPVFNPDEKYEHIRALKDVSVLVVTGIAHPKYLYNELEKAGARICKMPYRDHYSFKMADINKIEKRYANLDGDKKVILTTEKDAIRLRELNVEDSFKRLPVFYVPVTIYFQNNGEKLFKEVVSKYISRFYD
jgi:tetraacyldisaccharide 4'-kinase